ncbi:MAG: ethanolamine ammonia-lyase reactivating factor EutA, partial [Spirochaetaceae bacterium]|jgi:ethanolamine utilization protein EutA|nr:ethanolamine ammonia-lyase reactivating factor EutA [Spirochaetaceae bacterium]
MEDVAGYFSVPQVNIVSKEIIYKGPIHETPLESPEIIDARTLSSLINADFAEAGFAGGGVDTGAVIITGESARKENARSVLEQVSGLAGDFVVSTAGPDLEAIIAGQGSGAAAWSHKNNSRAVNLDIGGGTTNIAVFENGEAVSSGSLDIGGRQVRIADGKIRSLSPAALAVAEWKGLGLEAGDDAGTGTLGRLCEAMAEILDMAMGLKKREPVFETLRTPGSAYFEIPPRPGAVFISGGVADAVYEAPGDPFAYGDIGPLLGKALRQSALCTALRLLRGSETIRATVVGAGSCTVSLSGSTIFYRGAVFPRKNVPVLRLRPAEEAACYRGEDGPLSEKAAWFLSQHDSDDLAVSFAGMKNPGYSELTAASGVFSRWASSLKPSSPLIIVTERDMAKALGQMIAARLSGERPLAVLDSIRTGEHSYIDLGRPVMGGVTVPVVIKTLIFG